MQIAIIGPGAMGCLFGAMLSKAARVVLIHYKEDYVRLLKDSGIIIEQQDGKQEVFRIPAVSEVRESSPKVDLAIIFTKSHQTRKAAKTARKVLKEDGLALTLQNGLGNLEVMEEILGKGIAVAGVTSHGATLLAPGHVRHAGKGPTHIAFGTRNDRLLKDILLTFNTAGIETEISHNLESLVWGKLIVNAGINALTAIFRVENGVLGTVPECEKLMAAAVEEAAAITRDRKSVV